MQFKKKLWKFDSINYNKKYWHANKVSTFKSELKAIENLLLYTFIYIKTAVENFYGGEEEWMGWYFKKKGDPGCLEVVTHVLWRRGRQWRRTIICGETSSVEVWRVHKVYGRPCPKMWENLI